MCITITGNKQLDSTIIPGAFLGLIVTLATMFFDSMSGSTSVLVDLFGLAIAIGVICAGYYYFELREIPSFTTRAVRLCMFIATFALVSNVTLFISVSIPLSSEWFYLLVPALVLIACYVLDTTGAGIVPKAHSPKVTVAKKAVKAAKPGRKAGKFKRKG